MTVNLDMSQESINTSASPVDVVDTIREILCTGTRALVSRCPSGKPVRNGRKWAAAALRTIIWDDRVSCSVSLEHGKRRTSWLAVIVAVNVSVEGSRDGRKCCKLSSVLRRARQSSREASSVGVASGIHPRLVNAVVVLDAVDQVGGEDLVAHAGRGIRWAFPISLLYPLEYGDLNSNTGSTYVYALWIHSNHVGVNALIRESRLVLELLGVVAGAVVRDQERQSLVGVIAGRKVNQVCARPSAAFEAKFSAFACPVVGCRASLRLRLLDSRTID